MPSAWRSPPAFHMCCVPNYFHSPLYQVPLLAQSSPTATTTSSTPAPVLYQQKFRSPIKVSLKCNLFHEDFSEPTNHRKSLLPPNSGVILPIFLLRSYHILSPSWGMHVCALLLLPLVKEVLRSLTSSFLCQLSPPRQPLTSTVPGM